MRYIYTYLLAIGLAACALSPQVVVINPELKVATEAPAAKPVSISVAVEDKRDSVIIGQRGGVYEKTSDISTDANMTASLQRNVTKAFNDLGYTEASKGKAADAALTVKIINVHYAPVYDQQVLVDVETSVEIQAVCRKNGNEYTGTYKARRKKGVLKMPGEQENEQLVNDTFATVLEYMLKDKDIITFIDGLTEKPYLVKRISYIR